MATPVLLLPGWNAHAVVMRPLEQYLARSGWPDTVVEKVQFDDIWGSNIEHASEIATAVDRILARTGADRVDIVAHSMGGLATRWYMAHRSPAPVRRAVFIGTPHRGTYLAWTARGRGGREMRPGSKFLRRLDAAGIPGHVQAHTIRTSLETRVVPARSAKLRGAADYSVGLSATHPGLLRSRRVFSLVVSCLRSDQDDPG